MMNSGINLIFLLLLVFVGYVDCQKMIIPNKAVAAIFALNLLRNGQFEERAVSFLMMGLLFLIASTLTGGMGGGDVKLIAASALSTNFYTALVSTLAAMILCMLVGAIKKRDVIPFAPFLAIGYGCTMIFF